MSTCTKTVKMTARGRGVIGKRICGCAVHADGLCKKHHDKRQSRLTNWEDRPDYRQATQDDLNRGRSMKLKGTHVHRLFMCRQGVIKEFSSKESKYLPSGIAADPSLFVVIDF